MCTIHATNQHGARTTDDETNMLSLCTLSSSLIGAFLALRIVGEEGRLLDGNFVWNFHTHTHTRTDWRTDYSRSFWVRSFNVSAARSRGRLLHQQHRSQQSIRLSTLWIQSLERQLTVFHEKRNGVFTGKGTISRRITSSTKNFTQNHLITDTAAVLQ